MLHNNHVNGIEKRCYSSKKEESNLKVRERTLDETGLA